MAYYWILAPTVYDLDGQNARVILVVSYALKVSVSVSTMQPLYWEGISKSPQSMVLLRCYPEQQVRSVWDVLVSAYNTRHREGRTLEAHEYLVAECGDKPGSLEQYMLWLREAGFSEVAALHVVGGCVLIAAVKR